MARRPFTTQRPAGATASPPSAVVSDVDANGADADICPVCKSSRYLNPNMRFLVNPECYHKMCESCVDRIFSHGPAQCPIAGCKKTLRKHRFRKQTFDDVRVEREVDIRRRVAEIFNRREDEFESLLSYNNYLEEVENITFNLINNIDVAETERKLAAYRDANSQTIKRNASLAKDETASLQAQQAAEKEQARLRRQAARREEEEERREVDEGRREILDKLAKGQGNADRITREGESALLKKSSLRRQQWNGAPSSKETSTSAVAGAQANEGKAFVIQGLKKPSEAQDRKPEPYDPFGGLEYNMEYYVSRDKYDWDWLKEAAENPVYTAGGYDVREYCQRALVEAFSGLGVFVDDETAGKNVAAPAGVAAQAGVVGASNGKPEESDDVF